MLGSTVVRQPVCFEGPRITSELDLKQAVYEHYTAWVDDKDDLLLGTDSKRPTVLQSLRAILSSHPHTLPPPASLVAIVKGLRDVEKYLPDYVRVIAEIVRHDHRVMFLALWAGEEGWHSRLLEAWLHYAANYTSLEAVQTHEQLMAHVWDPRKDNEHFGDAWYGAAYTMWQELITAKTYGALVGYAKRIGQSALEAICRRLTFEEMGHHKYYKRVCELLYLFDPQRAVQVIFQAHQEFKMPGDYVNPGPLPDYREWTLAAMRIGIFPINPLFRRMEQRAARSDENEAVGPQEIRVRAQARQQCLISHQHAARSIFDHFGISMPNEALLPGYGLFRSTPLLLCE